MTRSAVSKNTRKVADSTSDLKQQQIRKELADFTNDPYGFVLFAFPWGKGELEAYTGPDEWQTEVLMLIRDGLSPHQAMRVAVASGHGIGKSALISWIIIWALATLVDTRGVVTANTATQLASKTWAELAKWHRLSICSRWFTITATAMYSILPERELTWRFDAVPWSIQKPQAFAGLHNQGRRAVVLFDEASTIDSVIWETTEGALTDANTELLWLAFGNPTSATGRFRECFGRFRHRWVTRQIDSRTSRVSNKTQIAQWVDDYGEDSDFVRVRVKGTFPRAASMQFISSDLVDAASSSEREAVCNIYDPRIMGVDVARFGDDSTVIRIRVGRDARTIPTIKLRGQDTMTVATRVVEEAHKHHVDAIFVDAGGVGGGVVDRLHFLKEPVQEVNFGGKADRAMVSPEGPIIYANKRAEMWGYMRDWLTYGTIDPDPDLITDLTGIEYGYCLKDGRDAIQLEKKEDMKRRGLASPDNADALALTFAYPVAPSDHRLSLSTKKPVADVGDYDPYAEAYRVIRR